MKKVGSLIIGLIFLVVFVTGLNAQTLPNADLQTPKPSTHTGNVASVQGTTLTVTGGKGGETAFDTATATWVGYASSSDVKVGDSVSVTYVGIMGSLNKAISVSKQSSPDIKAPSKLKIGF